MISFFVTHHKSISIVGNKVYTCVVEFGSKFVYCNFNNNTENDFLKNILNKRETNWIAVIDKYWLQLHLNFQYNKCSSMSIIYIVSLVKNILKWLLWKLSSLNFLKTDFFVIAIKSYIDICILNNVAFMICKRSNFW